MWYSNAYTLVKGTIADASQGQTNNCVNKKVILKNCGPFTNCKSRINNAQVDDASHIDLVIPMYILIENSDNCLKTSGIL